MKKLEDIPKKEVFKVPDGYFENLPGIIQARVKGEAEQKSVRPVFTYVLPYAVAAVVIVAVGFFWYNSRIQPSSAESILASVETADLVAYLNDTDITTEELLESVQLDINDVDEIEGEIYGQDVSEEDFEEFLDDL
jgi:hypothetical protein